MCDCCQRACPVSELVVEGVSEGNFCDKCVPAMELVLSGPVIVFERPAFAAA